MQLTVALPGLLWLDPGDKDYLYPQLTSSNLNHLIKRSKISQLPFSYSDLLYSGLGIVEEAGSLAQQIAQKLNVQDNYTTYLIAEPTHLRADRDRLLISEAEILQLNQAEAQTIISTVNQHFSDELKLYYISAEFWLIGLNLTLPDSQLYPSIEIIGENIADYLPKGQHSIEFSRLLTEMQMLLFNLDSKQLRHSNGLISVNSLWLWDKQIKPQLCQDFKHIFLDYHLLNANEIQDHHINKLSLGRNNAKIGAVPAPIEAAFVDKGLIIIDSLYYPCRYRDSHSWLARLQHLDEKLGHLLLNWLQHKKLHELNILVPRAKETLQIQIRDSDKYKFWKNNTLAALSKGLE